MIDEGSRITQGSRDASSWNGPRRSFVGICPRAVSTILDVGGATGVHAQWLAADGHDVHVVDLVPATSKRSAWRRVPQRRAASPPKSAMPGTSLLPTRASTPRCVLGPLYHLTDRKTTGSGRWPRRAVWCNPAV